MRSARPGRSRPFQTISTLPADYTGMNTCSQIRVASSGRYLFVPNRGHNSVASFRVDASSGRLTFVDRASTDPVPRAFGLDPDDRYLFATGQQTGRLTAYRVEETGALTPLETYEVGNNPMWVLMTTFDG